MRKFLKGLKELKDKIDEEREPWGNPASRPVQAQFLESDRSWLKLRRFPVVTKIGRVAEVYVAGKEGFQPEYANDRATRQNRLQKPDRCAREAQAEKSKMRKGNIRGRDKQAMKCQMGKLPSIRS